MADRPVSRREAERIARLAHVTLDDQELDSLRRDLGAILSWVRELGELDVTGIEPTTHPIELSVRLRNDVVESNLESEPALAGAPERAGNSFGVPRVIE